MYRSTLGLLVVSLMAGAALAQPAEPAPPQPPPAPTMPASPAMPTAPAAPTKPAPQAMPTTTAAATAGMPAGPPMGTEATATPDDKKPKEPKRGDFDAGGQVRLPSGPDENNKFATFNWVALDLKARYFLLDSITVNGNIPLAVKKPDKLMDGTDPNLIGGITARLELKLPKMGKLPGVKYETEAGLVLSGGYMREGAFALSEKDYPLFVGDFEPGFTTGLMAKVKLSTLVDFSTTPVFFYQAGTTEALDGVQIPMSLILKVGSLAQVSADLGVFTGDNFSFGGDSGGRIATGGSLTLKIGPILAHAGAGVASLLTGGLYPTISDSVYIDLNVKYAK